MSRNLHILLVAVTMLFSSDTKDGTGLVIDITSPPPSLVEDGPLSLFIE